MSSPTTAVLSQGAGYGIVLGVGLFFSAFMILLTYVQSRYTGHKATNAEEFASASRSVKPGLIASGIVSAWTWAATLLTSSTIAFNYGLSGPWWYAAGATVQILLFAQNAAKIKMHAPYAHTFLEVVKARWGVLGHATLGFFAIGTNVLVSAMLITGASATVSDLTGMSTYAACVLIPLTVVLYVVVGGMRATLLADYTHTTALFIIIMFFFFTVYAQSALIGSPSRMYELLTKAAEATPIANNAEGTPLTFRSRGGLIFGVINVIGNFATVYLDQAYWQRAIASRPQSAVKAFMLGGVAWLPVPFCLASTLGLAAFALKDQFPSTLGPFQISQGLAAPTAAAVVAGSGGAGAILLLLFLAVTSATSAELIAVSNILSYDVYRVYINPHASQSRLIAVQHMGVAVWGVAMMVLGIALYEAKISMGWLYEFMGVALGSAVVPTYLAIAQPWANKWACIGGCVIGFIAAIASWLGITAGLYSTITVATTFEDYSMLTGNLVAIAVGGIVALVGSLVAPDRDFSFDQIRLVGHASYKGPGLNKVASPSSPAAEEAEEKTSGKDVEPSSVLPAGDDDVAPPPYDPDLEYAPLHKAYTQAKWASLVLFGLLVVFVPAMAVIPRVWTVAGFTAWIVISIIWLFVGATIVILLPIYESRAALGQIGGGIVKDAFGQRPGKTASSSTA